MSVFRPILANEGCVSSTRGSQKRAVLWNQNDNGPILFLTEISAQHKGRLVIVTFRLFLSKRFVFI